MSRGRPYPTARRCSVKGCEDAEFRGGKCTEHCQKPVAFAAKPDLNAAREYARWFIGSSEWADLILRAYNDPEWAARKIAESRNDP